ncbi:MAG TPA: DUF58 domain-containing protein [Gemmatimonas sp.]|uniref:DUF58 domain-containing protein n=1 Tax=Gemmatimonas sp. TaxID=1962908 RepID=UPI002ED928CC
METHLSGLPPTLVTAIDDLELAARVVVEGLRVGGHRSPFNGAGAEFHQHRLYRAGDDLKHLDWKVYARSDRLYTRQSRETTNVGMMLVLDTSRSMDHPSGAANSKLRYAILLAAALAYLAIEQGNAVGLMTLSRPDNAREAAMHYLPARSGRVHLRALLARLGGITANGVWDPPLAIGRAAELLQRRGLIMVLSDFYDQEAETQRELRHVVQRGHDVAMLQLLSPDERTWSFDEQVSVRDLESGSERLVEPAVRATYAAAHTAFLGRCHRFAQQEGIDYGLFDCGDAPEQALRDYLLRRSRGAAGHEHSAP